jgi:putative nucleotidyltransferase with HDIG domain
VAAIVILPLLVVLHLTLRSSFGRLDDARQHLAHLDRLYLSTVETLAMAIDAKDDVTHSHVRRVQAYALGLARALGVTDDPTLKGIEAAALVHDTGKLAVPEHILNKPGKLTDAEFDIMRMHVVDGAEILRRTPEMPAIAPVIAFEHHLRIDGTGYPFGAKRDGLNIGTMLCGIADVYDAMRSQRAYQQAHPTDRILAVLKRNDGTQFDQNLVRRFVQLLGIYPPGNLVRLTSGEVAVVTQAHAPDPHRPRVRVLISKDGTRLDLPYDRNLWEGAHATSHDSIVAPVDPSEYDIDPLNYLA